MTPVFWWVGLTTLFLLPSPPYTMATPDIFVPWIAYAITTVGYILVAADVCDITTEQGVNACPPFLVCSPHLASSTALGPR
ncbi:MAG: hypothetical protein ACI9MC_004267 [Kiritimatiellia bacterium]|jgi:hypothetical protein